MVRVPAFEVERWMDEYELTPGVLNTAETCAASVSLNELADLADDGSKYNPVDPSMSLVYGAITGTPELRQKVASLIGTNALGGNSVIGPDDVLITQGAISANFQVIYTLLGPGDHAICVYPTYQQLFSLPETVGAEVSLWRLKESNGFVPDVAELEGLVKPNTKMIIINNPNNPTGVVIPTNVLQDVVDFARSKDLILFSDEVYRPLFQDLFQEGATIPPSAAGLGYDKVVVTGSMSKAYSLAGIRIGWAVSKDKSIVQALTSTRDYATISVSRIDDQIANYALSDSVRIPLMKRNVQLARENLALLSDFIQKYSHVLSWVKPTAGTTAFIKVASKGVPVDEEKFCLDILSKTKVFFVPGKRCFGNGEDFAGYVRAGYVCHTDILKSALEALGPYLDENFS